MTVVRHPTDVVFLTNILMYTFINLPSAILLFRHFTYLHGIAHLAFSFWCVGPFTLMLHNHIHNNGVLSKALPWSLVDFVFPYIFEPLIGHTWDSYYYHHVKHHHVEGNGPDDLSSTVRYQRDSILGFAHYVGRFLFLIWYDLPVYFLRKNKPGLALRCLVSELANYAFIAFMTVRVNPRAGTFVLVLPFTILRLGLMIGNWGQHALVDEQEPDSDFRSSITLIDVPVRVLPSLLERTKKKKEKEKLTPILPQSNRFCFNDGYHTAHHLNPRRHWREQPVHFLQSKAKYTAGRALVFTNIDYLMLTVTLLRKDYAHLAKCFVPIGEAQMELARTPGAVESMLRSKTRKFSEADLRGKFPGVYAAEAKAGEGSRDGGVGWRAGLSRLAHWLDGARLPAESLPLGAATLEAVPAGRKKAE
jgi:hypothetical protein